jgi:hypothetical protein
MDPIGRQLDPEEQSVLTVLTQEGRLPRDCTVPGVAIALERDVVDVAGVLRRLERDGLTAHEVDGQGEESWRATRPV